MKRDHEKFVAQWLNDLAVLTAGLMAVADAKAKAAGMASLLADDFPDDGVFNRKSLRAVADGQKFFPAYSEVKSKLADWWAKNSPSQKFALPGPVADSGLNDVGKRWAAYFIRKVDEGNSSTGQLATLLHLIRSRDETAAAYEWLIWKNSHAAAVAREMRMPTEATIDSNMRAAASDWQEPGKVQSSVDGLLRDPGPMGEMCLSMLRLAVKAHAPDNLHLVPERLPEIIRPARMAVPPVDPAAPVRKPTALTPEQIAEVRKNPTGGPVTKSGIAW